MIEVVAMAKKQKHRLVAGQRSLYEAEFGEKPVTYCRRCKLRLRSAKSIDAGIGPVCQKDERKEKGGK
ncbi:hypothetical protein Pan44_26530 [Caulifigura coniformis]|uniref:Uncharacterized protein n=1 Tax=Caulifigura coniformis TaxID=2527983 RepID=A0A517SET9_9PLAN|nr:DUF6011 domain-containing protein [Caulifigura coniformis]QDT54618.1 hypothetical protein Pan44_26530 [Caulifigura coniformis]